MRFFVPFKRLLLAGIVAAAAALSLVQVAMAGPPPPVVPGAIQVPAGNKVFLVGHVGSTVIMASAWPRFRGCACPQPQRPRPARPCCRPWPARLARRSG